MIRDYTLVLILITQRPQFQQLEPKKISLAEFMLKILSGRSLNLVFIHPTIGCVCHELILPEARVYKTGNEARRQVRPRGIVLDLSRSAHQPILIDILRKLRLQYVEFSSKDLEVSVHVAVAEDRLDILRIVSMIFRSQRLILPMTKSKSCYYKAF